MNETFWQTLDRLVTSSQVVIDRAKGSVHPRYKDILYPLDYGFLEETTASDSGGIDVFVGSLETKVTGAVMTVDLGKRDAEMKVLIGCSGDEMRVVHGFLNSSQMGGALLVRGEE